MRLDEAEKQVMHGIYHNALNNIEIGEAQQLRTTQPLFPHFQQLQNGWQMNGIRNLFYFATSDNPNGHNHVVNVCNGRRNRSVHGQKMQNQQFFWHQEGRIQEAEVRNELTSQLSNCKCEKI